MRADAPRSILKHSAVLTISILMLAICWWPIHGSAQAVTATINGTITDPAGSVVANAEVTATDLDRGTVWPAKTNATGFYNLNQLPVGRYEVRAKVAGFRTAVESNIELQLNQVAAVNIQLQVGANSETVQVTNEAPLLQSESTEVSTVLDARTNVDLPLASRNYVQLTLLTPGAVSPTPSGFTNGQASGESSRPEINGNRFTANDYILDGMDNNQASDNFVGYAPAPDAIQEFNVISQNAPADFGNYMGGIISAAIKSGTNSYHGSVYEFFRNDALNANEWKNKLNPGNVGSRTKLRWNQYGGAIGGPIKRDKIFYFADYEGERFDFPTVSSTFSVFTADERTGNVSELVAAGKTIIDPLTGLAFPDNQIPANRLSPAALAIINSKYYPTPITAGLTSNALNSQRTVTNADQGDGKLDWAINEKNHYLGRFSYLTLTNPTDNSYSFAYNGFNTTEAWNFVTGFTTTITPSLLNDARLGVNYVRIGQNHESSNFTGSAGTLFSIPGLPTDFLPAIQLQGADVTGPGGSNTAFGTKDSLNDYYDTAAQYQDVVSWTHGKHSTRVGFQGWRLRMNGFFPGNSGLAGNFQFNGHFSGSAESDFLLGLPVQVGVGTAGPDWGQRGNIFAGFVQDDWKVTPKLVLNLGLRYELHTAWYETKNLQDNWNPITGVFELPGQNGNSRALYDTYQGVGNYQPRLGIAYLVDPKTTVRASYGLSSFMEGTGQGLRLPENPPSSKDVQANYSALDYPTTTLDQGFGGVTTGPSCTYAGLEATSGAPGSPFDVCYNGAVIRVWDKKVQPAHSNQWSLFFQHELTPSATFQLGYVGQQTRHLTVAENLAQLVNVPGAAPLPSPYFAQNSAILQQEGALPLATYSAANQNYHALQSELQGRLNHGLSYLLSYTWAKCMTNAVGFFGEGGQSASQSAWWQNQYNPKGDYGACYYQVKNDFTGFVIYDLPIGRGKAFGGGMNRLADAAVGEWRVSAIPTFRGGFPLSFGAANDEAGTGGFAPRPDCIGSQRVLHKQPAGNGHYGYQWVDQSPYYEPKTDYLGTCSVSSVYGPGEQNVDISLAKSFPTFEKQNLEFRAEFINAFNHVILDSPSNGCSAQPGQSCDSAASTLGIINSSEGARQIQFALKYNF